MKQAVLACALAAMAAVGAGHAAPGVAGDIDPQSVTAGVRTGYLQGGTGQRPGAISGVRYRSGDIGGYTDAEGRFSYRPGEPVSFFVGDVELGTARGAEVVTPFSLAGSCDMSEVLGKIVAFLYSLDADADPSNSLQIPTYSEAGPPQPIASLDDASLDAEIKSLAGAGAGLVDARTAIDAFIALVDGEAWQQDGYDTFPLLAGLQRSQGAASDGRHWFFSW
jgi:hypothetical protein